MAPIDPLTGLPRKQAAISSPVATGYTYTTNPGGSGGGLGLGGQLGGLVTGGGYTPASLLGGAGTGAAGAPPAPFQLPDLASLIAHDSVYTQGVSGLGASHDANISALSNAIRQAVIGYGQLPDQSALTGLGLPSEVFGALNNETAGLANQNTQNGLSTLGRLNDANTQGASALKRQLAARGALNSGEAGYQFGRLQKQYTQAQYDSLQKLLGLLGGDLGSFNTQEQSNLAAQQQAASEAANRQADLAMFQYLAGLSGPSQAPATQAAGPTNPTASAPPAASNLAAPPPPFGGYAGPAAWANAMSAPTAFDRFHNPFNPNR